MTLDFVILDVFTSVQYSGNPLAVVRLKEDISQEQKQLIAREFNLSETVFLHEGQQPNRFDIFTTTEELPFAGHPTIGTAVYLRTLQPSLESTQLIAKAGSIPISYESKVAKAQIPHNVHVHKTLYNAESIIQSQPALSSFDVKSASVVSIVKGMTFVLIELPSVEALNAVSTTSVAALAQLDEEWKESFTGHYFFVALDDDAQRRKVRTRMIDKTLEDPATGSAACTLSSFLSLQDEKKGKHSFQIIQGVEMGRRSDIFVDVETTGDSVSSVTLAGEAVIVSEGVLYI